MTVRPVLKMGDPLLLRVADPVQPEEFSSPDLLALIEDLRDTMSVEQGIGIAAPQIGVSKQIVIFGGIKSARPDIEAIPFTVLCNPVLTALDDEMADGWEGCLSVPGMRGKVPRFLRLHVRGVDERGVPFERTVEDFHARVVQHECDHLSGVLYPMRIRDMSQFGFVDAMIPRSAPADEPGG